MWHPESFSILLTIEINSFLCQLDRDELLPSKLGGNLFSWSSQWKAHPRQCLTACLTGLKQVFAQPCEGRSPLWPQPKTSAQAQDHSLCLIPKASSACAGGDDSPGTSPLPIFPEQPNFSWNNRHFPCKLPLPAKLLKCPLLRLTWAS